MDETALKSYLLGLAAAEQQLEIEEWLINPDNDMTPLEVAEDELIEEFLDGSLNALELRQFHAHFLAGAGRKEKLQFVDSLRRTASRQTPRQSLGTALAAFFPRHGVLGYAIPALTALIIIAGALAVVTTVRLQRELRSMRDQIAAFDQEREAVAQLKRQQETLQQALADVNSWPAGAVLRVSLLPGISRSPANIPSIVITPGTRVIQLSLTLTENNFGRYRATILDGSSREVWRVDNQPAGRTDQGTALTITVPSQVLPPGDYSINLFGLTDSRQPESINNFLFSIGR
jgi:hypothetical protein